MVAGLAGDGREPPARVDGWAAHRYHRDGRVGAGVPARSETGRGIERGDATAGLAADVVEPSAGVDGGATHRQGRDRGVGTGVPAQGGAGGGIECGDAAAGLAADVGEVTADVDRAPAHDDGIDLAVWIRVPGCQVPARIQLREVCARLAEDGGEGSAEVPAPASIGSHGVHLGKEVAEEATHRRIGLPGSAGDRIQRDRGTRGGPDRGEAAAQVDDATRDDHRLHRAVRDPQVVLNGLGSRRGRQKRAAQERPGHEDSRQPPGLPVILCCAPGGRPFGR